MNFKKQLAVLAVIAAALVGGMQSANATVIDFDSVETVFWIDGAVDGDFDVDKTDDGLGTLAAGYNESYWRGNGTGRLLSWTNVGSTSGFTLARTDGVDFALESFDFGNGYVSGNEAVSSITLTGLLASGTTITESFANTVNGWTTIDMSSLWTDLVSVEFVALGADNRAVWDNISVDAAAPVSEPAAISIFLFGLLGLVARKKAKS